MTATAQTETPGPTRAIENAARIPPITRAEARALAEAELDRFTALVETLGPDDWTQPTACTEWDVSQILAHQAGAYAGYASWREFRRQFGQLPARGQLPEDMLSARQVADRAQRVPAELLAELRACGSRAVATRQRIPLALRLLGMPYPGIGLLKLGYMLDIIYPRDTWMHRLDIGRATGRPMVLTPEHDGRLVALVMRDVAGTVAPKLGGRAVVVELAGPAGGTWQLGPDVPPAATIRMDTLDFNILASGRFNFAEARARANIEGDVALGELALRESKALY